MTMYDIIFESLQKDFEAGKISEEEAVMLNEAAFEKYSDVEVELTEESTEDDEPVILEDIDKYLEYVMSEKSHYDTNKWNMKVKIKGNKSRAINAVQKEAKNARDNTVFNLHGKHKNSSLAKSLHDDATDVASSDKFGPGYKKGLVTSDNVRTDKQIVDEFKKDFGSDNDDYKEFKNRFNDTLKKAKEQKKGDYGKALDIHDKLKKGGLLKKESVTETKLNIYEAFESGTIDADEKTALLGLLADE